MRGIQLLILSMETRTRREITPSSSIADAVPRNREELIATGFGTSTLQNINTPEDLERLH